jgi:predicted ATPase
VTAIGRAHQTPLIGRERERQIVHSLVLDIEQDTQRLPSRQRAASEDSRAPQRHPQCVLLLGEAGIGKTRLAEEMGRFAQQRGWTVLWGRSYAQESTIPYHPWTEVLRKAIASNTPVLRRTSSLKSPSRKTEREK